MYRTDFSRCPIDGGEIETVTMDPLIGQTIAEHYTIERLLGEGAMGRVYRAHHARLVNKGFALKILLGDLAASATMRMRFAKEAENVSRLDHPNIVGVVDFGRTESGLLFMVMELVEGPTLGDVIRTAPMSPARARRIAGQLCAGLSHAHERGVVHRDFKPDNILVIGEDEEHERACIADFGLAISTADDGDDARLTTSGIVCTPAYAAPEQLVGGAIDRRADLYALGCTLFEILTGGIMPFGNDPQTMMSRKLVGSPPSIIAVAPHVPASLVGVLDRLLDRDREKRFQTADEVAAALDGTATPAPIAIRRTLPARRRHVATPAILACLAAAAPVAIALRPTSDDAAVPIIALPREVHATAAPRVQARVLDEAAPEAPVVEPRKTRRMKLAMPGSTLAIEMIPRVEQQKRPEPATQLVTPPHEPIALPPAPVRPPRVAPRISSLGVQGGLSYGVVLRAIERVLPDAAQCGGGAVAARFTIGETRRATAITANGTGAQCVSDVLARVRTESAPDVGSADVRVRIELAAPRGTL
jgi:serine/threonine-protein kinase